MDKRYLAIALMTAASAPVAALNQRRLDTDNIPDMSVLDDFMIVSGPAYNNGPMVIEAAPEYPETPVTYIDSRPANKPWYRDHDYPGNHPMKRR